MITSDSAKCSELERRHAAEGYAQIDRFADDVIDPASRTIAAVEA
jgi:hypothetical protein